jgi:hypothetical protein
VLAIEESSRFYVDGCIGIDIGVVGFRPESLNIVSSQDVCVNNVKLRISNTFDTPEDAALRPVAVAIGAGTFAANNRVTIRNVDTSCRGANISHGVLITAPSSGSHTNINVDGVLLAGNGTYSGGATQPNFVRAFGVDGLTVGQLKHVGTDTPTVMLEATAINSVVSYGSAYAAPTITDAGASNRIIVDGVESGVWAPLLIGSMVVGTNTYVVNVGEYQKTGRVVTLRFRIELSSFNSTGNIRVTGLPFPVSQIVGGVNMDPGTIFSRYSGITLAAGALPGINAIAGQNRLDLGVYSNAGVVPIEHTDIAATAAMQGTITYITV